MFERPNELENIAPLVKPPRRMQSEAEHIHRAAFTRSGQIRDEVPGAVIQEELQDQEPRAIIRIFVDGQLVRMEFFESTFSADQQRFLEEYVQAARACGNIAVLYPGLSFPEDYVLRNVESIFLRIRAAGINEDVSVHGFLYDFEGLPREVV